MKDDILAHDNLRDQIGQAISLEMGDDPTSTDWFDSREVDRLADAVLKVIDQDVIDAKRWRALLGSARIRPLGSAGIKEKEERDYAHLGVELWTVFSRDYSPELVERLDRENALGREWLIGYADIAAKTQDPQ